MSARGDDFCAVVLASGSGSKLFPISNSHPKCLINVGNQPLVYYPLKVLEDAGFSEALVSIREGWLPRMKEIIPTLSLKIKVEYFCVPSDYYDSNTASILFSLRDKLKSENIFVISSDVFGDVSVKNLANTYRKHGATFCAYIQPPLPEEAAKNNTATSMAKKNFISSESASTTTTTFSPLSVGDRIAFNESDSRLLICVNDGDLDDEIVFKKSVMAKYPSFKLYKDHNDLHIYIFKKHLLDFLALKPRLKNIKSDVIPYLLERQFSMKIPLNSNNHNDAGFYLDCGFTDEEIVDGVTSPERKSVEKVHYSCYAYLGNPQVKAFRVNTIPALFAANVECLINQCSRIQQASQTKPYSLKDVNCVETREYMLGRNSQLASNAVIKRSLIGWSCVIGDGCKIFNCLVLNNVRIEKQCFIQNSVIGNDVIIYEGSRVTGCIIGTKEIIPANSNLSSETVCGNREFVLEDDV